MILDEEDDRNSKEEDNIRSEQKKSNLGNEPTKQLQSEPPMCEKSKADKVKKSGWDINKKGYCLSHKTTAKRIMVTSSKWCDKGGVEVTAGRKLRLQSFNVMGR